MNEANAETDSNRTMDDVEPKPSLSGLSYMEPGSVVIFSKEEKG